MLGRNRTIYSFPLAEGWCFCHPFVQLHRCIDACSHCAIHMVKLCETSDTLWIGIYLTVYLICFSSEEYIVVANTIISMMCYYSLLWSALKLIYIYIHIRIHLFIYICVSQFFDRGFLPYISADRTHLDLQREHRWLNSRWMDWTLKQSSQQTQSTLKPHSNQVEQWNVNVACIFFGTSCPPPDSHISKLSQPRSEQCSESNNYI